MININTNISNIFFSYLKRFYDDCESCYKFSLSTAKNADKFLSSLWQHLYTGHIIVVKSYFSDLQF